MAHALGSEAFVPGILDMPSDAPLLAEENLGWRCKLGRQVTSPNQSGFSNGGHGFSLGQAGRRWYLSKKWGAVWECV